MGFTGFERVVSFAPGSSDTKWLEAEIAKAARAALGEAQREGAANERFVRAVNGRRGVAEERVVAPGAIVYSFNWVREAAVYATAWLKTASPRRTGRYARSFIVTVGGRDAVLATLPLVAEATVINTQPYSRKIQVGAQGFESRRGLFDQAARRVNREFRGLVKARVKFVRLSSAYRLRGSQGRRRDRRSGSEITYPAIEIVSETVSVN